MMSDRKIDSRLLLDFLERPRGALCLLFVAAPAAVALGQKNDVSSFRLGRGGIFGLECGSEGGCLLSAAAAAA